MKENISSNELASWLKRKAPKHRPVFLISARWRGSERARRPRGMQLHCTSNRGIRHPPLCACGATARENGWEKPWFGLIKSNLSSDASKPLNKRIAPGHLCLLHPFKTICHRMVTLEFTVSWEVFLRWVVTHVSMLFDEGDQQTSAPAQSTEHEPKPGVQPPAPNVTSC